MIKLCLLCQISPKNEAKLLTATYVHCHLQRTGHVCRSRWQQNGSLAKDCGNYSAARSYDACFANLIIPFVVCVLVYGCETWSLTLREERRLRAFENMVLRRIFEPKRDEVTAEWRQPHNEEPNDFTQYCWVIKSRRIGLAGHVARMGRGVYRILAGKPERKRPLGRPRHR